MGGTVPFSPKNELQWWTRSVWISGSSCPLGCRSDLWKVMDTAVSLTALEPIQYTRCPPTDHLVPVHFGFTKQTEVAIIAKFSMAPSLLTRLIEMPCDLSLQAGPNLCRTAMISIRIDRPSFRNPLPVSQYGPQTTKSSTDYLHPFGPL